jgi:hypothetical protein
MLRRLPLVMFIISVGFLSYLYGVASTRFNLFPYEIVRDAWVAGKAAREALANEFDQMPPGAFLRDRAANGAAGGRCTNAGSGSDPHDRRTLQAHGEVSGTRLLGLDHGLLRERLPHLAAFS